MAAPHRQARSSSSTSSTRSKSSTRLALRRRVVAVSLSDLSPRRRGFTGRTLMLGGVIVLLVVVLRL